MKKAIGGAILALVWAIIFVGMGITEGWIVAICTWAAIFILCGLVWKGMDLIFSE